MTTLDLTELDDVELDDLRRDVLIEIERRQTVAAYCWPTNDRCDNRVENQALKSVDIMAHRRPMTHHPAWHTGIRRNNDYTNT